MFFIFRNLMIIKQLSRFGQEGMEQGRTVMTSEHLRLVILNIWPEEGHLMPEILSRNSLNCTVGSIKDVTENLCLRNRPPPQQNNKH